LALVVDTGPLVAALDTSDDRHGVCARLLLEAGEGLVLPSPILPEVDYLLRAGRSPDAFGIVVADIRRGAYQVAELLQEDYERVGELLAVYRDARIGFVDASVLAIVERLGERKLATLDHRHFGVMRPRHVDALELLPA
jgi:predicted nucleic acid-binding protein